MKMKIDKKIFSWLNQRSETDTYHAAYFMLCKNDSTYLLNINSYMVVHWIGNVHWTEFVCSRNIIRDMIDTSAIINIAIFRYLSVYNIFRGREPFKRCTNSRRSFFAWHEHTNTSPTFQATRSPPLAQLYCNRNPFPPCVRHGRRSTPIKTAVVSTAPTNASTGRFGPREFCGLCLERNDVTSRARLKINQVTHLKVTRWKIKKFRSKIIFFSRGKRRINRDRTGREVD